MTQSPLPWQSRLADRLPFFYGWIIVGISFLCVFLMGATSFWAVPIFVAPMHEDTGWSHTVIFSGLSVHFLAGAIGGLLLGSQIDKHGGATRILVVGVLVEAVALFSLRWATSSLQFVLLYGVVAGLGGSTIRLVQASLMAKWFIVKRGTAVGFASIGGGISALLMVPVTTAFINQLGWRDAWGALGGLLLLLILPCAMLAVRAPEDLGLHPDNRVAALMPGVGGTVEHSFTLQDVIRTWQFWLLVIGVLVGNFSLQTHTAVVVPHFEHIGFSKATAATAISIYGLFSIGVRFVWGAYADKRGVRIAIITQAILTAICAFTLLQVDSEAKLYVAMAFQGLVLSGYPPLQILVWPEFFGRAHIGSIVGLTQFFSVVVGAGGPLLAGFLFDQTGTYRTTLWLLIVTWLACAVILFACRPMVRKQTVAPAADLVAPLPRH